MSLALDILDIVENTARNSNAATVKDIFIDVGALAGVMIPSLEFGLEVAKQSTCASEASIHIREIEGRGRCSNCDEIFPMEFYIETCPRCESNYLSITSGDELRVREIEVETH